jgi:hypothetical protein
VELAGVLETVLYCTSENEDEMRRFNRGMKELLSRRGRKVQATTS